VHICLVASFWLQIYVESKEITNDFLYTLAYMCVCVVLCEREDRGREREFYVFACPCAFVCVRVRTAAISSRTTRTKMLVLDSRWPKRMETIMQRMQRAMDARLPYEMPEDRSEVRVIVLDAVTRKGLPWSIVQVNALGLAAQKLKIASAKAGLSNGSAPPASKKKAVSQTMIAGGSAELSEKKTYRVQTDGEGVLNMRLPGGRYELLGLADGYVCEYPLEMSVRPFSKNRVIAKVAVLPNDAALDQAGGRAEEG
jgi:hypothetical protein